MSFWCWDSGVYTRLRCLIVHEGASAADKPRCGRWMTDQTSMVKSKKILFWLVINTLGRKLPATDQGPKSHPPTLCNRLTILAPAYTVRQELSACLEVDCGGGFWNKNTSDIMWPVPEENYDWYSPQTMVSHYSLKLILYRLYLVALWYRLSVSLHVDLFRTISWLWVLAHVCWP